MFGSGNSCLAMKAMAGILQRWRREKPCLGVSHVDPSIPRRRSVGSSVDPVDLRETPRFRTLGRGHWHHGSLGLFRSLRLLQAGRLWRVSWWETGKSCWMIWCFLILIPWNYWGFDSKEQLSWSMDELPCWLLGCTVFVSLDSPWWGVKMVKC